VTTVVLCGSLGSSGAMWDPQAEALAGFDVVRLELPGHGGTGRAEVGDVADLARLALDAVGVERFSWVGASLGGAVGMRIALDAPDRIERLALVCTSARFGPPEVWHERAALVRVEGLEAVVDAALARWFTPSFADVRRYREMFLSTDAEAYARCCDALARWDVRDAVARIAAPALVVSGTDDVAAPPEHGELLAARIPGARHVVVPGGRHLLSVERADEVNPLLLEHLR
jgi:3-oxoadipate enol-lactonase